MKKEIVFLSLTFFLFILLCFNTGALSSEGIKDKYQPKETIIGELKGNILESINKDQIELKRRNVLVPFDGDVKKLEDRYFFWIIAPESEGDYTLRIRDISSTINGKVEKIDYETNISVNGSLIEYNINPGVIYAKEDFEVNSYLYLDDKKEISVGFPERSFLLNPGENKILFKIKEINQSGLIFVNLGEYRIPMQISKTFDSVNEKSLRLRFKPQIIRITILKGTRGEYPFQIVNFGEEDKEFYFEAEDTIFSINSKEKERIGANQTLEFNITLKKGIDKKIISVIYAKSGNESISMPIEIDFTQDQKNVSTDYLEENSSGNNLYYCESQNGIICKADEVCSSEEILSLNGKCCLGKCSAPEGKSYKWIGYILAGIAVLLLFFAWTKYKKSNGESSKEIMDKRVKDIEKRLG